MSEKSILRNEMLEKRALMPDAARTEADRKIFERIISLREYRDAKTIFCYVSVSDEPDTRRVISESIAQGKRVCVPRCKGNGMMDALEIKSLDDLTNEKYGIPEPPETCLAISPDEIDLILVPCVCCDRNGYRLGYGGGYYDRWLASRTCPAAVLCFEDMLASAVPVFDYDERVDILITDADLRYFDCENVVKFKENGKT